MRQIGEICQAKRTVEQCVLTFLGTIAFWPPHVVADCTLFFFLPPCPRLLSRPSSRFFPSLCLDIAPFRSCLSMPQGNVCHAGGWHLRRKLRVVLLLRLPSCLFGRRCAQMNSDSSRRISIHWLLTQGVLFFFAKFVFSHITLFIAANNVHSFLSSIMYSGYAWIRSNVIGSWCLHRHSIASGGLTRCCMHSSESPHGCVEDWLLLASRSVRSCVATCHACFSVSFFVDICTSQRPRVPYDGMGLSMETVLDSSRRHVPEGLS